MIRRSDPVSKNHFLKDKKENFYFFCRRNALRQPSAFFCFPFCAIATSSTRSAATRRSSAAAASSSSSNKNGAIILRSLVTTKNVTLIVEFKKNNVSIRGIFCSMPQLTHSFYDGILSDKIVCRLSTVLQFFVLLKQWKPLNRITLGQRQTYSNNQLMIIREFDSIKTWYERVL